jgi:EAL domain-containing protein (putative c-di-GMP-specific phosphodiesterase class I)
MKRYDISGHHVELEITEREMIQNRRVAKSTLEKIKALDCQIALDDFGVGYSNIDYLTDLPIDVIKIDYSLMKSIPSSYKHVQLIQAMIHLCHKLELKVVAEGIEKKEQLDWIKNAGCDYFQGYYKSRPLPEADFNQLIK